VDYERVAGRKSLVLAANAPEPFPDTGEPSMNPERYNGVIQKKLSYLKDQLRHLRSWDAGTLDEFRENILLRRAVERELQVCVEVIIDLCEHILAVENMSPAESSVGSLEKVAELGIIKDADTYAPMIRFRNFVVHRYEQVDPDILYDILENKLSDFDTFVAELETAVESRSHESE